MGMNYVGESEVRYRGKVLMKDICRECSWVLRCWFVKVKADSLKGKAGREDMWWQSKGYSLL